MRTTVVNRNVELYDVYIGRPSKWGNPFKLEKDTPEERQKVLEEYGKWIQQQPELMAALGELKGKKLGCYCKPKRCHGDILAVMADMYG